MTMIGVTLAFLAVGSPSGPTDQMLAVVKPEVAIERVRRCGFTDVRVRFDGELQENVVEVANVSSATDSQLRCTADASFATIYYVMFPEPIMSVYWKIYGQKEAARNKLAATDWLRRRNLLSRLPRFDPKDSDRWKFVHQIERLCGMREGEAFEEKYGTIAIRPGRLLADIRSDETFMCLMYASAASGSPFGFIGNEAYRTEPEAQPAH